MAYSGYVSFLIRAGSIPNSFGVKRSIPAYSVFGSRLGIDPRRSIPSFLKLFIVVSNGSTFSSLRI